MPRSPDFDETFNPKQGTDFLIEKLRNPWSGAAGEKSYSFVENSSKSQLHCVNTELSKKLVFSQSWLFLENRLELMISSQELGMLNVAPYDVKSQVAF